MTINKTTKKSWFTGATLALCTTVAPSVFAQDPMAEPAAEAPSDPAAAPESDSPEADADVSVPEPEPSAEPTEESEPAEPEAEASEETDESSEETDARTTATVETKASVTLPSQEPKTSSAPADKAPEFDIERLPPSAYPNTPVRGLVGGSLTQTMNGLQWPYMPKRTGRPATRIGLSGSTWFDASIASQKSVKGTGTDAAKKEESRYASQGRSVLRVTPVYNHDNGWFLQSQTEFVANGDQGRHAQYIDIDDLWIRVGKWGVFDVQAGRMQGWEVYHFGMGLDLNTFEREGASFTFETLQPQYGVTDLWNRSLRSGSLAGHYYPFEWARFELQGRFGVGSRSNELGFRPVGILDFDFVKLKIGGERRWLPNFGKEDQTTEKTQGIGGSLHFVFDPWIEAGGGIAQRVVDSYDLDGGKVVAGTTDTITLGGYLNINPWDALVFGGGFHKTTWENQNVNEGGTPREEDRQEIFGAVQYTLWNQLMLKYIFSPATGEIRERADAGIVPLTTKNDALSHRFRIALMF